jgi:methyl-accepting chemotaxis protein
LFDLPISSRLTLGFILAALLATLVTGAIGFQRAQSLGKQSTFYKDLLTANTNLNTGANYLQLMNSEMHVALTDASAAHPSQETLSTDKKALVGLAARYDQMLTHYIGHNLVNHNSDQVALLNEAGEGTLAQQQVTLAGSAQRAWQVYKSAQSDLLKDVTTINPGSLADAQHLEQSQGEPTNADAISSLHDLIQLNNSVANSVGEAATVEEQNQFVFTIISSIITFIGIVIIGSLISNTLVRRLKELRRVTQLVEQGRLEKRVTVVGRDEIADVSASVNGMLDAIVGLIGETRNQRDALTNAAEHLFSDMRVVSAGDLRINASVSNDPIGMLANAFNFTVGRFRRFVLRTQGDAEQIDLLARREITRAESHLQAVNKILQGQKAAQNVQADNLSKRTTSPLKGGASTTNSKEPLQELARLNIDFATETSEWARKMIAIVNGLRQGTISFQLETAHSSGNLDTPGLTVNAESEANPWPSVSQLLNPPQLNQWENTLPPLPASMDYDMYRYTPPPPTTGSNTPPSLPPPPQQTPFASWRKKSHLTSFDDTRQN